MTKLQEAVNKLADKERELEHLRNKILKGEVGGHGAVDLIEQIQEELKALNNQIEHLKNKRK